MPLPCRKMATTDGAAKYYPGGRLKFDEKGRRVGAETVILQWRNGTPVPVYPPDLAVMAPLWAKRWSLKRRSVPAAALKSAGSLVLQIATTQSQYFTTFVADFKKK